MTGTADVLVSALEQAQDARAVVYASVCKRGRHRWLVVEKTVEPTTLDKLLKAGLSSVDNFSPSIDRGHTLVHYRCAECGTEDVRRV